MSRSALVPLAALVMCVLIVDVPLVQAVQADATASSHAQAQARWLEDVLREGALPGAPVGRAEGDGSTTLTGFIEDAPGPMERHRVEALSGVRPESEGGLFLRSWTGPSGQALTTVGAWVKDGGQFLNVNLFVLEGVADPDQAVEDFVRRDAAPLVLNSLPFVLNHAHPTSVVLMLALILGVAAGISVLHTAGQTELAGYLTEWFLWIGLAPVFDLNVLYPYHTDAEQGEIYRDWPDVFLWRGIKQTPAATLWDGLYLSRHGGYQESVEPDSGTGTLHMVATAWKRDVVGPAYRLDDQTEKLPGIYVRQDIKRHFSMHSTHQAFEAQQDLTVGAYHESTGESPGANVRMHETKEGDQTFVYAPRQEDTISAGVRDGDDYTPLLGTKTQAWHRPYTDTTNQGDPVGAIESYRITSFGFFVDAQYVPVYGADYWGERNPTDLWALTWALGGALGDQAAGDVMARTGVFADDDFVPVVGTRVDDDFAGHRHTYRTMVSAGLFVDDPTQADRPVPGESPDGARYVPLVATTYDGVQTATAWALANVNDEPAGMGTFLLATGGMLGERDAYAPLVGVEYAPEAHEGKRRAQETYRVGVFPADYATFVPLAAATYDGEHTTAAQAVTTATGATGAGREGRFDTTQGAYAGDGYVPVTGVRYAPTGTDTHGHGYRFVVGAYGPDGAFTELGSATLSFSGAPTTTRDACDARVDARLLGAVALPALVPPCRGA